ncbi:MAG: agmatine deiminase family protein [Bacteroidales bacterium]
MNNSIFFPPEWHQQKCVQLTWPHKKTDFTELFDEVVSCFVHIACEIAKRQQVLIVCENKMDVLQAIPVLYHDAISCVELPVNDVWARDHGGISVYIDKKIFIYDFAFNGWGHKYPADKDTRITASLYEKNVFPDKSYRDMNAVVLEGGSIDTNGAGVLLTTSRCLLDKQRNPTFSQDEYEQFFAHYFGIHTVLWLNHGYLAGDDTDGHIDTLARFVDESTIVYVSCDNPRDEHYVELKKMEAELRSFQNQTGEPFRLVPLPMPDACIFQGERKPATYANFLIINNAVLVPTYNCMQDAKVLQLFRNLFPQREIVGVDSSVLITQNGSLHCVSMQYY